MNKQDRIDIAIEAIELLPTRLSIVRMQGEWEHIPSQDNEGYVPDRGGFKAGWLTCRQCVMDELKAALAVLKKQNK